MRTSRLHRSRDAIYVLCVSTQKPLGSPFGLDRLKPPVGAQVRERLTQALPRGAFRSDDLHDALAALWTGFRIVRGVASVLPEGPEMDRRGLRMEINA